MAKYYRAHNQKNSPVQAYKPTNNKNYSVIPNMFVGAYIFKSVQKQMIRDFALGDRKEKVPHRRVGFERVGKSCWAIYVPESSGLLDGFFEFYKEVFDGEDSLQ